MAVNIGFVVLGYLLGSISFGILMSKAFGLPDPRTVGSGNIGATNIARSGKKLPAILTLLGDAGKGWLAVFLAQRYGLSDGFICVVALAAFLGHLYPVFCGFKGGKGVATAVGILLAFSGWVALICFATWAAVFAVWRYSSLAALIAACWPRLPLGIFYRIPAMPQRPWYWPYCLFGGTKAIFKNCLREQNQVLAKNKPHCEPK